MANIKDIAKLANVSKSTVSRVVSNKGYVKPETRQKIEEAMEELNYRPNMFAKGMRTNKSYSIGIVFPDLANPFFSEWYEVIDRITRDLGYLNYICISDPMGETEESRIDDLLARKIDGIILFSYTKNPALWKKLESVSSSTPVVCCDSMFEDFDLACVFADGRKGTYKAFSHLYNSGRRRIAYIKGKAGYEVVNRRFEGYCKAVEHFQMPLDDTLVYEAEFTRECGVRAAEKFMALEDPPDAIMASTDHMALGVLDYLNKTGYRVPQEVAVFGYDNLQASGSTSPPLSTVSLPIVKLAETSISCLIGLIDADVKEPEKHVFDCELVLRGSA